MLAAAAAAAWVALREAPAAGGGVRYPGAQPPPAVAMQRLRSWLAAAGADVSGVEAYVDASSGARGLRTTRAFDEGDALLTVPFAAALSAATSGAGAAALHAATAHWRGEGAGELELDALVLLFEWLDGGVSRFRFYVDVLPLVADDPASYPPGDAALAAGVAALPELARLVAGRRDGASGFYRRASAALEALGHARPTPEAAHWAVAMAKTRTLSFAEVGGSDAAEPGAALGGGGWWADDFGLFVPVFDLANHAGGARATAKQRWDGRSVALVATRQLAAGTPVEFSYRSDDDENPACGFRWLLEYGFSPDDDGRPERDCFDAPLPREAARWAPALAAAATAGAMPRNRLPSPAVSMDGRGIVTPGFAAAWASAPADERAAVARALAGHDAAIAAALAALDAAVAAEAAAGVAPEDGSGSPHAGLAGVLRGSQRALRAGLAQLAALDAGRG